MSNMLFLCHIAEMQRFLAVRTAASFTGVEGAALAVIRPSARRDEGGNQRRDQAKGLSVGNRLRQLGPASKGRSLRIATGRVYLADSVE
jgi:hypothetical protein